MPDDIFHKAAFLGALASLGAAYKWQDDLAHTAREVALVWQRIADELEKCGPEGPIIRIYEEENPMPIRVDCDCRIWALCCDGTTEVELTTQQMVEDAIRGLPKGDARQPTAGGGCETYNKTITGAEHVLIPVPVSDGDTIQLEHFEGASNEHGFARWLCGDGGEYFAGKCTGITYSDGAAYMPSVPLGTLIVNIDGTYYDGRSLITVPGGVSNIQPFVLLNYNPASGLSGTLTFDAEVCNNSVAGWMHDLDLTLSPYSSIFSLPHDSHFTPDSGVWSAGVGYVDTLAAREGDAGKKVRILRVQIDVSAAIDEMIFYFAWTGGTHDCTIEDPQAYLINSAAFVWQVACPTDPTSPISSGAFSLASGAQFSFIPGANNSSSDPGGSVALTKIHVEGHGADPFA